MFDHATPIGEIVVASPTHYRIEAEFRGRAAHAGVRPEAGRSAIVAAAHAIAAMRLGRLDDETTANVGMIDGGTAINVVPEHCRIEAEVRSLDDARAAEVTTQIVDHLEDAANATECDLDLDVAQMFSGYRTKPSAPQVLVAERALRACGYEPKPIDSGGGSDANSFRAAGLRAPAWPTASSTTTSRLSGSAHRRSRRCSRSRSRWSTRRRSSWLDERLRADRVD